jgi:hypothetical protein
MLRYSNWYTVGGRVDNLLCVGGKMHSDVERMKRVESIASKVLSKRANKPSIYTVASFIMFNNSEKLVQL